MIQSTEIREIVSSHPDRQLVTDARAIVDSGGARVLGLYSDVIRAQISGMDVRLEFGINSFSYTSSCNCKNRKQLCKHALAALIQASSEIDKSNEPTKRGTRYWREFTNNLPDKVIRSIVSDYARRNKAFALELRAQNLIAIDDEDLLNYSKEILDDIKLPLAKSAKKPNATSIRLATNTLKALYRSTIKATDEGSPLNGSLVLTNLITTAHYVLHRKGGEDNTLRKLILDGEKALTGRLDMYRAPEIRDAIFEACVEMISKSYYIPTSEMFFPRLFQIQKLPALQLRLLDKIESQIHKSDGGRRTVWLRQWVFCQLESQAELPIRSKHLLHTEDFGMIWEMVLQNQSTSIPTDFLDLLYSFVPTAYRKPAFQLAMRLERLDLALELLSSQKDIELKGLSSENSTKLLERARASKVTLPQIHTIELLKNTGDLDLIVAYVKKSNELQVTVHFCSDVSFSNEFLKADFLFQQIETYMSSHIGPKTRQLLNSLLNNLNSGKNKELRALVQSFLEKNYGFKYEQIFTPFSLPQT